jgi:acetyl esterase/lipase
MHTSLPVLDGAPVHDADLPFCAGLTEDERRQIPPGRVGWGPSLTYRIPEMARVRVVRGVVYRVVGRARLRLDAYIPREAATGELPRPAIVYVHGGGWVTGTRRQSRFMMYELAAAGWVVFAISYRLAPWAPLPAAIEDCKAAVAWIRAHAAEYGADARTLVAIGGSAGGQLAAMLALTPNDPRFQPGFEGSETRVDGAVVFYGMQDFAAAFGPAGSWRVATFLERVVFRARYRSRPEIFHLAQPVSHVRADAPPMLMVHGTHDHLIPVEQSQRFAAALRAAGARTVHLLEVPAGQHAFEVFPSPLHQRAVRVVVRFLASLRGPDRGG